MKAQRSPTHSDVMQPNRWLEVSIYFPQEASLDALHQTRSQPWMRASGAGPPCAGGSVCSESERAQVLQM